MNNLQIFKNEEFGQVRTVTIDGEPWFVGKDVAEALGYEKARNAISAHVDEEDKKGALIQGGPGGAQTMTIINESGLYSLIFGSKLESAKRFKHWVTSEVLPALRKTGHYETPQYKEQARQRDLTKDDYIRAASIISGCRNERMPYVMAFLEQAGLEMPALEQVRKMRETVTEMDGLAEDEKLAEYADEVAGIGLEVKGGKLVPTKDFNEFCAIHKISARKYRLWLYRNGYIKAEYNNTGGRISYTVTKWIRDGKGNTRENVRGVLFI